MSDPLVQQQETGTMTTDRTGNKERTHAAKDGESHASHDTASAPDHSNRELPEGEVLEGKETQTAEAENRNKNGQERDDKKVSSSRIIIVTLHIRKGGVIEVRWISSSTHIKAMLKSYGESVWQCFGVWIFDSSRSRWASWIMKSCRWL